MKYICGDAFRDKAGLVLDNVYKGVNGELYLPEQLKGQFKHNDIIFYENSQGDSNIVFCRTDLLPMLIREVNLEGKILITHNSDININSIGPNVIKAKQWMAQNGNCDEVTTIPLGLENERFDKWSIFDRLRLEPYEKNIQVYLNCHPASNPHQRYKCIEKANELHIANDFRLSTENYKADQERYLQKLKESYFVLCPEGAGIDTHRMMEALYMGAIPIVTESKVTKKLSQYFPLVILKEWGNLDIEILTEDLYNQMWDLPGMKDNLDFEMYWKKIVI